MKSQTLLKSYGAHLFFHMHAGSEKSLTLNSVSSTKNLLRDSGIFEEGGTSFSPPKTLTELEECSPNSYFIELQDSGTCTWIIISNEV